MVTSLAGTWTFTPSGAAATTITVPGGGWIAQGFRSTNEATYQRVATVPNLGRAQATYLEFRAISHQATLTRRQHDGGNPDDVVHAVGVGRHRRREAGDEPLLHRGRQRAQRAQGVEQQEVGARRSRVVGQRGAGGSSGPPSCTSSLRWNHVFETLVRTDVAADQFSIDVWVKNDGHASTGHLRDRRRRAVELDLRFDDVPDRPLQSGFRPGGTDGQGDFGAGHVGARLNFVLVRPNVPYVQGYRAKLHVARVTVTPDAAGGAARLPAHSIPVRFGFRQSRQGTPHTTELNGVPIKSPRRQRPGRGLRQHQDPRGAKDNSDAYDLFPGFLPPSANNPGWPQAVDNWQRLELQRGPPAPGASQRPTCSTVAIDEMWMMVIDESAIRGSNNDQDFQAVLLFEREAGHLERARAPRPGTILA